MNRPIFTCEFQINVKLAKKIRFRINLCEIGKGMEIIFLIGNVQFQSVVCWDEVVTHDQFYECVFFKSIVLPAFIHLPALNIDFFSKIILLAQ